MPDISNTAPLSAADLLGAEEPTISAAPAVELIVPAAPPLPISKKKKDTAQPTLLGVPPGVRVRKFFDPPATRQEIFDRTKQEIESSFPYEDDNVRMELSNLSYPPPDKMSFRSRDIRKAIVSGSRLAVPLRGTVSLFDKSSGQKIDEVNTTLLNVPYYTDRGSFVTSGSEWFTRNQHRLKPGIYARKKENGQLESHFNIMPGTAPSMRFHMEPDTGVFRVNVGQADIKLYPVLRNIGVPDEILERHWGPDIVEVNKKAADDKTFRKFYDKMFSGRKEYAPDAPLQERSKQVLDKFKAMQLDPEVTTRTLGNPHTNVSPDAILEATSKLIQINKGEAEEDDRDSLANKTFHSVEDFIAERIKKDAGKLKRQLAYRARSDRSLKALKPGYFSPYATGVIIGNSLTSPGTAINMLDIVDNAYKISPMGEGGISSAESLSDAARNVNPSHAGVLDFIRTSESTLVGADARVTSTLLKGSDGNVYVPLRNRKTGQIEYLNPAQMSKKTVAFPKPRKLLTDTEWTFKE